MMTYLDVIKISFLLVINFALSVSNVQAAQLETETRGFYNLFDEASKFLSPVNGMMVLSETLPNLRFKGRYGKQNPDLLCHYQITNPSEGHQPTSEVDCPQDYTSAIIQHFFPSPAGGILRTPALDKIDLIARMDLNAIGNLLRTYALYATQMARAKSELESEKSRKEFSKSFLTFFNNLFERLKRDGKAYIGLSKQWTEAGVDVTDLPKIYATMFTNAFEERNHYPAHVIEYTLLAYAWKKAVKRDQIVNFINGPLKEFKKSQPAQKLKEVQFSEQLYWQWRNEAIIGDKLAADKFKEWLENPEVLIFMTVGYNLFENPYPKMLDFGIAVYSSASGKTSFADCGETSLRNFFNLMIRNSQERNFDLQMLTKAFPNIRETVVTFYKDIQISYSDVLGTEKDRNAWVNSISGLDPKKISYRETVCNIKGEGIDNILAALEELLGDDELKNMTSNDEKENRASKLQYIVDRFNEARNDGTAISWSQNGQSKKLSAYPIITFKINDVPVFEWTFKLNHFTFLPIESEVSTNWLLNTVTGFETILKSDLPDSLKRRLLPFYFGDAAQESYLAHADKRQEIKDYAYDFLFGRNMTGQEQTLKALDIALTLNAETPLLKDLARHLIQKSFLIADAAGDSMLVAFLFKHKEAFADPTFADFGDRVAQLYKATIDSFETTAIQNNLKKAQDHLEVLLSTPFTSDLVIHAINNWPKPSLLSMKFRGRSILHLAVEKGWLQVVETLLTDDESRRRLLSLENLKDHGGLTALHYAAMNSLPILETLLKNEQVRPILLSQENIKNKNGRSPLHLAESLAIAEALLRDEQVRQILLSSENIKDKNGDTFLHKACLSSSLSLVEAVLKDEQMRQIFLNPENIKNVKGLTPLHSASSTADNSVNVVETLLKDQQARTVLLSQENIKNNEGKTALNLAASNGLLPIVEALLNDGETRKIFLSQENLKDKHGLTPLHMAALLGFLPIVKALLKDEETRNILLSQNNLKSKSGNTPLHMAAVSGYVDVMEALLDDDVVRKILLSPENIKTGDNRTPIIIARKNRKGVEELLRKYGVEK